MLIGWEIDYDAYRGHDPNVGWQSWVNLGGPLR